MKKDKSFTALSKKGLLIILTNLPDYRSLQKIKYTAKEMGMYIIQGMSCNCKTNRQIADAGASRRLYVMKFLESRVSRRHPAIRYDGIFSLTEQSDC